MVYDFSGGAVDDRGIFEVVGGEFVKHLGQKIVVDRGESKLNKV